MTRLEAFRVLGFGSHDVSFDLGINNNHVADGTIDRAVRTQNVTSSGTTAELETYDFDSFTNSLTIEGVFPSGEGTISISEVRTMGAWFLRGARIWNYWLH